MAGISRNHRPTSAEYAVECQHGCVADDLGAWFDELEVCDLHLAADRLVGLAELSDSVQASGLEGIEVDDYLTILPDGPIGRSFRVEMPDEKPFAGVNASGMVARGGIEPPTRGFSVR